MKAKQIILLFLALLMPVAVFLFLKGFGKNEFNVPPMFTDAVPALPENCSNTISVPYIIPAELMSQMNILSDSLSCVSFTHEGASASDRLSRVKNEYATDPLRFYEFNISDQEKMRCVFLLGEPFDVALVDRKGRIRGQYNSSKRDEIDRLMTEIAIIFKKY